VFWHAEMDALSLIPVHIPSEHPGGEAQRGILKARAAKIPWFLSKVFSFSMGRKQSAEDTIVVHETFGNVR
jgi:hypothetical protein